MIWTCINILSAIIVSLIVAYKLGAYPEQFTIGERLGMGAIAAGMLMRIGPILGKNLLFSETPFDDWSVTLLHVGLALYFTSRLLRVHRHWINNERAKNAARRHLMGGFGR